MCSGALNEITNDWMPHISYTWKLSSHYLPTFLVLSLSEPLLRWPPLVPGPIRAFEKLRILGAPLLANWRRGLAVDESTEFAVVADVAAEIDVEFEAVVATEADR
jgi:hypothetical protein